MEIFEWIVIRVRLTGAVKGGGGRSRTRTPAAVVVSNSPVGQCWMRVGQRVAYYGSRTDRRTLISNHMVFLMKESEIEWDEFETELPI